MTEEVKEEVVKSKHGPKGPIGLGHRKEKIVENKLNVLSKVELELIDRVMCRYVEKEFFVHPTDIYTARLIMKKVRRFNSGDNIKIVEKLNIDAKLITEAIERIG